MNVPDSIKVEVYNALVKEFSGKGKFVGSKRVTKEWAGMPPSSVKVADVPVYEFILRVDGSDNFELSILSMLPESKLKEAGVEL